MAAAIFSASMVVGILVLPRVSVGMMEASTTRSPAKPRTRPAVSTTALRIVRRPHAAGADRVKLAGDIVADVLGERRVVLHQRREIDPAIRQRREHRPAQRRNEIEKLRDDGALESIRTRDPVEHAQPVGEFDREGHAANFAHPRVGEHLDGAAERDLEALQIELMAGEVELDQRLLPRIGRR